MIQKIANFGKWQRYLMIVFVVLSFALIKSFALDATNAVNGIVLSVLLFLAYGVFHWLLFEVLIGFLYSGIKAKIEKDLTLQQFNNIFRFTIIPVNIILFLVFKLIIHINFYANIILLLINTIIIFAYLAFMWWIIKKYFLKNSDNKLEKSYFGFVFMYLFLQTIV